jgi:phospholipase/carboxylesterase
MRVEIVMELREFGGLTGPYLAPAHGGAATSAMMLLHGWGADGNDLADLARPYAIRFPGMAFFVPNGPDPCKMNPAGREWFDIDDRVHGPDQAAPIINKAVTALLAALKLDASALVLAGFSQGGMMSLHCGLRLHPSPAAIVSFSGALLRHDDLPPSEGHVFAPVQLVHGSDDQVVPFALMAQSAGLLRPLGVAVDTVARPGLGHGIDPDGLSSSINFLAGHVPQ